MPAARSNFPTREQSVADAAQECGHDLQKLADIQAHINRYWDGSKVRGIANNVVRQVIAAINRVTIDAVLNRPVTMLPQTRILATRYILGMWHPPIKDQLTALGLEDFLNPRAYPATDMQQVLPVYKGATLHATNMAAQAQLLAQQAQQLLQQQQQQQQQQQAQAQHALGRYPAHQPMAMSLPHQPLLPQAATAQAQQTQQSQRPQRGGLAIDPNLC